MSDDDAAWDNILPELHDDGKGFTIHFCLHHEPKKLTFGADFYFRYPEEGLPPLNVEELREDVVGAVMWVGHRVFPNDVPNFEELEERYGEEEDVA